MHKLFIEQVALMERKHKTFRLIERENSILMKVIYYGLLMFLWNKRFMDGYTTTIISWVYMQKRFFNTDSGYMILRHEDVHIEDCWRWWVLPFVVSYVFLLPIGVTIRQLWEKRGYRESMKTYYEMHGRIPDSYLDHIAIQFTGPSYLYMWPFPNSMKRWLRETRQEVIAEVDAAKSA